MDRLVGRDLTNMINSFLGGGKKDRAKKKKKQIESVAPATPEGSDASGAMSAAPSTSDSPDHAAPEATPTPTPAVPP
jgi:hypothetical protein